MVISRWIFTEAHTGKKRLDNHYSFLNKKLQAYVEDDNNILIDDDIVKAISFNLGIGGTTAVLIGADSIFGKMSFKNYLKNKYWRAGDPLSVLDRRLCTSNKFVKFQ